MRYDRRMKSKIPIALVALIILGGGYYAFTGGKKAAPLPPAQNTAKVPQAKDGFDPKNATYSIDGDFVSLFSGLASKPAAPGSATQVLTQYFGNNANGDLNGDGRDDMVFLVTQDTGGSGRFYYLIAAINLPYGYRTTDAISLGDRIAPQTTTIKNGVVTVTYTDRKPGQPMSATPSVGVSKQFTFDPAGKLIEKK